jgi:hypothetical protein
VVALAPLPSPGMANPFGPELLIGPAPFFVHTALGAHALAVPPAPSPAGLTVPSQGFRVNGALSIAALNALDPVLGS